MSCIDDAGKNYMKGHNGWQKGFGETMVSPSGHVDHQIVLTDGGEARLGGMLFQAKNYRLPDDNMTAVRKFWLRRFGLSLEDYVL